jgi:hypothetical protein
LSHGNSHKSRPAQHRGEAMNILLTPEELLTITGYESHALWFEDSLKNVSKAQLKRVVEWLEEPCTDHLEAMKYRASGFDFDRSECHECRKELKEGVK